ncbi:MAG: hypothetical protein KIG68_00270 [Oxalobacter sp.]|nr:hypothetical protein [Oxalobacter sp.]
MREEDRDTIEKTYDLNEIGAALEHALLQLQTNGIDLPAFIEAVQEVNDDLRCYLSFANARKDHLPKFRTQFVTD